MNNMDMTNYFNIDFTKNELKRYLKNGIEPELCIKIDDNDYMIIPLKDKISFQQIGKTKEIFFKDVEELFAKELINGIILNRDWNKVKQIWFY